MIGVERIGQVTDRHPGSFGSRWSRPLERWSSACWRAGRVVKPMADAASSMIDGSLVALELGGDAAAGEHGVATWWPGPTGRVRCVRSVGCRAGRRASGWPRWCHRWRSAGRRAPACRARSWSRVNLDQPLRTLAAPSVQPSGSGRTHGTREADGTDWASSQSGSSWSQPRLLIGQRRGGGVAVDQHGPERRRRAGAPAGPSAASRATRRALQRWIRSGGAGRAAGRGTRRGGHGPGRGACGAAGRAGRARGRRRRPR